MGRRLSAYFAALLNRNPSTGKTLPELDGLRGLAVLIVIASHTNLLGMKGQGSLGVWLFFVLSGFMLTWIFLRTLPGALEARGLARYVVRRVARILPMYFLFLGVVFLLRDKGGTWLWRHVTFRQADGHFWSIPQEEIFYLLLPLLMGLLWIVHRMLPMVPMFLPAVAILSVVSLTGPPFHLDGNGVVLPFYLQIFLLGLIAAILWHRFESHLQTRSGLIDHVVNGASLGVLCVMLFTSPIHHQLYTDLLDWAPPRFGWQFPLRSGLVCVILLFITLRQGSWVQRLLSLPALRVTGVLSFAMYLAHPFVITLMRRALGLEEGAWLFAVTLIVSLFIALVLQRTVERPCMALGRRVNKRFFQP